MKPCDTYTKKPEFPYSAVLDMYPYIRQCNILNILRVSSLHC